jgi:hypothetical protein
MQQILPILMLLVLVGSFALLGACLKFHLIRHWRYH